MTFKKHWLSSKISGEGYSVRVLDRGSALYEDPNNHIVVGIELLTNKGVVVFRNQMWSGLECRCKLDDEGLRSVIVERVTEALEFTGLRVELEE